MNEVKSMNEVKLINEVKLWRDVWNKGPGPIGKKEICLHYVKGFLMGAADLIPGVSGGTVAFILGFYRSLLDAVASIDKDFFKLFFCCKFKQACSRVHLRVLLPLVAGILTAIFTLARLMHYLLEHHALPTWGVFFGLIAASIIVVAKDIQKLLAPQSLLMLGIGVFFGYVVVTLIPIQTPNEYWFIYLCGIIGITAMILPGISGSFLLLILGKYEYITAAIKAPFVVNNFVVLMVFTCGTVTGLLGFSRILAYFLKSHRQKTMAFLTGLLIGTLKKLWPWKEILESKIIRGKTIVLRDQNILPDFSQAETMFVFSLMIAGFVFIMLLEKASGQKNSAKKSVS